MLQRFLRRIPPFLLVGIAAAFTPGGCVATDSDTQSATGGGGGGGDSTGGGSTASGEGGSLGEPRACDGFATDVVDVTYGIGAGFGQNRMPDIVLGAPQGMGLGAGSLHVLSLGNGGSITLSFKAQIVDGPGPDFVVFENVFYAGGNPEAPYAEIGSVSVSEDGETWVDFECGATESPFMGCAGWHPTLAGPDSPQIDAHDPAEAGGDAFDLADVGLQTARFIRVTDREDLGGVSGTFDLDAISLVNWQCDASSAAP